jgi:hypothetical protein
VDATVAAAIATSISAGVIAWQAWETRRTAQAARESLKVGQESLDTARQLAAEAFRARLDARGQALRVHVAPPEWPPLEPSRYGEPQPLPGGIEYRMPRDADRRVMLRARLEIRNEGARDAKIALHPPLIPEGEPGPPPSTGYERVLAPGKRLEARLDEARRVGEWIDSWRRRETSQEPGSVIVATIVCSDAFDEGVIDRWRIEMYGTPLRPIPQDDSGWVLNQPTGMPGGTPPLWAWVTPHERLYYISKIRDQRA